MNDAIKEYEQHRNKLQDLLKYDDAKQALGNSRVDSFKKAIDVINHTTQELIRQDQEEDKCQVEVNKDEYQAVLKTTDIMLKYTTFQEITPWVNDFFISYISFVLNWNSKIIGSEQLQTKVKATQRLIEGHTKLKEMQELCTRVIREMKPLLQKDPSSLKLSRHYAKKIREED